MDDEIEYGYDEDSYLYADSGFVIRYKNHHTGRSKEIGPDEIFNIGPKKHNGKDVPLYVFCSVCDIYMDFEPGSTGLMDGVWRCSCCNTRVKEMTVYNQIDRENREFDERMKRFERKCQLEDEFWYN